MDKNGFKIALKAAEKLQLNDEARLAISGEFVALPHGNTHFEVKGAGENVVLVHGYATPYYIYDKLFEGLVKSGYRVLRYDLLGRGYSERVECDYTPDLFATQLQEISEHVFGKESFFLVGTSMGGTICATFTEKHTERVKKLILLAPAGMDNFRPPLYMKIAKAPALGELIFAAAGGSILLKKCASELYSVSSDEVDYYQREFASAMRYSGFLRCTLSSLRNTILATDRATKSYAAVGKSGTPILCIWGTIDKTMPYYQHTRLLEVCPQTELLTWENEGHIFVFDKGEQTTAAVLKFLQK